MTGRESGLPREFLFEYVISGRDPPLSSWASVSASPGPILRDISIVREYGSRFRADDIRIPHIPPPRRPVLLCRNRQGIERVAGRRDSSSLTRVRSSFTSASPDDVSKTKVKGAP